MASALGTEGNQKKTKTQKIVFFFASSGPAHPTLQTINCRNTSRSARPTARIFAVDCLKGWVGCKTSPPNPNLLYWNLKKKKTPPARATLFPLLFFSSSSFFPPFFFLFPPLLFSPFPFFPFSLSFSLLPLFVIPPCPYCLLGRSQWKTHNHDNHQKSWKSIGKPSRGGPARRPQQ